MVGRVIDNLIRAQNSGWIGEAFRFLPDLGCRVAFGLRGLGCWIRFLPDRAVRPGLLDPVPARRAQNGGWNGDALGCPTWVAARLSDCPTWVAGYARKSDC